MVSVHSHFAHGLCRAETCAFLITPAASAHNASPAAFPLQGAEAQGADAGIHALLKMMTGYVDIPSIYSLRVNSPYFAQQW